MVAAAATLWPSRTNDRPMKGAVPEADHDGRILATISEQQSKRMERYSLTNPAASDMSRSVHIVHTLLVYDCGHS